MLVTAADGELGTADSLRFYVIRALGHCRAQSAATRLRLVQPSAPSSRLAFPAGARTRKLDRIDRSYRD